MPYHESNSSAARNPNPNRNSVNLLNTTDQIDAFMFSLNSNAAAGGADGMDDMFGGNMALGHHLQNHISMTTMGAKSKKRRPEVDYSRG
jgi:hypothetical protein